MKPPYIQNAFAKYIDRDLLARNPILYAQLKECFTMAFMEGLTLGYQSTTWDKPYRALAHEKVRIEVVEVHAETLKLSKTLGIPLWGKEATS